MVESGEQARTAGVLGPGHTFQSVTEKISSIVLTRPVGRAWMGGFAISFVLLMVLTWAVIYLFLRGIGIWGVNIPVAWGFAIINFVWWIGIGHAGTLISAVLLLLRQEWRTSINRFAEAMTIFAVASAALFPVLHLGRPWLFYWLLPYPNVMALWPQFRSPLVWDVFAVLTYFTISLTFWYVGMIPDLATLRDRSASRLGRMAYGMLAMGWRGSALHWKRYEVSYVLLAGLATPLVVSVHTVVSFDFAVAQLPGWHSTIFPPYFVAGAIFSGFAMVLSLAIPLRKFYGLEDFVTARHLDNMAKIMYATGMIVAYGYAMEIFMTFFSGSSHEMAQTRARMFGPYAVVFWMLIFCNVIAPQVLWFKRVRTTAWMLFIVSLVVNVGMWLERFVIVVGSLSRNLIESRWALYYPTIWDLATFAGSLGLFFTLFLLFIRFLPMISVFEMRELVARAAGKKAAEPIAGEGRVSE